MKLSEYLEKNSIRPAEFARAIGVTPAAITGYCNGGFKPSAKKARQIEIETNGKVSLKDFVDEAAPAGTGAAR